MEARLEECAIRQALDIVVETEKAASPRVLVHGTVDSSSAALCLSSTFLGRVEERASSGNNWIGLVLCVDRASYKWKATARDTTCD